MLEKIKGWLGSSWTWVVAAVGAILYFWLKERDLQDKLQEEKIDATIKTDDVKIDDADAAAQPQLDHYESLLRQYNAERTDVSASAQSGRPSDPSPATTNTDKK